MKNVYCARLGLVFALASLVLAGGRVSALEINFRLSPALSIPVGEENVGTNILGEQYNVFNLGANGVFNADFHLGDWLFLGPEVGYFLEPTLSDKDAGTYSLTHFVMAGPSIGVIGYPLSWLKLQAGLSGGIYYAIRETAMYGNLWWHAQGSAGYRISPALVVGLNAGFNWFNFPEEPLLRAFTVGLTAEYQIDTRPVAGNVAVTLDQSEPVFPLLYNVYKQQTSIGTLTITNNESAEIRDVSVAFRFGQRIRTLQEKIKSEGSTPQSAAQLGLLYVRAGMYDEAKAEYRKAADSGYAPAMVNLGNLAMLDKDFETAKKWFEKALVASPDSKSAKKGLDQANTELAEQGQ